MKLPGHIGKKKNPNIRSSSFRIIQIVKERAAGVESDRISAFGRMVFEAELAKIRQRQTNIE